jgi:threonine/homoserine/homoserine lactone efflux protein
VCCSASAARSAASTTRCCRAGRVRADRRLASRLHRAEDRRRGLSIWLGIQAIRNARPHDGKVSRRGTPPSERPARLFAKGLVANAINPKVILFFLAFLPQFVDAARGHAGWQIVQLGLVFTLQTVVIFGTIGWFAGAVGERLARHPATGAWLDRIAGGIFVALGLRLIVAR